MKGKAEMTVQTGENRKPFTDLGLTVTTSIFLRAGSKSFIKSLINYQDALQ